MSRCFAYPPPGYVLPDNKGPLIESIKLLKDKEKTKEERRKERKREKKDKKRKREEQSTPSVHGFGEWRFGEGKLINEKSQKLEKQTSNLKGKNSHNQRDDESSDVTEERELPVCVAKPSYSSEDSQNSDKRRRPESPANTIHVSGSILKICLSSVKKGEISAVRDWPSFKKKGPNAARDLPSTSGRTDPIGQNDFGFGQSLVEGQSCCASTRAEICAPRISPPEKDPSFLNSQISKYEAVGKSSSRREAKVEFLYKTLFETWVTPALGSELGYDDDDELDWLFQRKFQDTGASEMSSNAKCSSDSNLLPHAQFLPSVNAFALPYTVPF